jgi:hypothetical protein
LLVVAAQELLRELLETVVKAILLTVQQWLETAVAVASLRQTPAALAAPFWVTAEVTAVTAGAATVVLAKQAAVAALVDIQVQAATVVMVPTMALVVQDPAVVVAAVADAVLLTLAVLVAV